MVWFVSVYRERGWSVWESMLPTSGMNCQRARVHRERREAIEGIQRPSRQHVLIKHYGTETS